MGISPKNNERYSEIEGIQVSSFRVNHRSSDLLRKRGGSILSNLNQHRIYIFIVRFLETILRLENYQTNYRLRPDGQQV